MNAYRIRFLGPALAIALLAGACKSGGEDAAERRAQSSGSRELGFADVASEIGLDFRHGAFRWGVSGDPAAMIGGGLCWLDYDGDGWQDLYVVNSYALSESSRYRAEGGLPRSALFHNVEGRFEDASAKSGTDLAARGGGCVAADLDLDGLTDLYVTTANRGVLFWNEGDGTFTEGAGPAGLDAFGWHAGAAVGDVDGDGWPDLFATGYADLSNPVIGAAQGFPSTYLGTRDLLFLNNGREDGGRATFREVGTQAGLEVAGFAYGLGALFSDLDRDGDLDLYVANDTTPDRLYDNVPWPGGAQADPAGLGFRFEELAGKAGVADPGAGMGVATGDYDSNGLSDLLVTNARGQAHGVFRGQSSELVDPWFVDVRSELGIDLGGSTGWGVTWADLDDDTDLDLMVVNGNIPVTDLDTDTQPVQVFENLTAQGEAGRYRDASAAAGLDAVGDLLARGSAAADYDNDGDLDVAINSIGGDLVLLQNTSTAGNWLEVAADVFRPGAMLTATLPDGRELRRELLAGSSYLSSEDPRAHFGLGEATEIAELRVRWPDGQESLLRDVASNQVLIVGPPR